ncbi:MAG: flagellar filament capping protein FliD [Vicinamibacterales bacterium]
MGSPITFSGFNSIDFTAVLEAVMSQESQPLTTLQTQQKLLQSKATSFRTLAGKLSAFESAVSALKDDNALLGRTASSTNDSAVKVSAGTTAAAGIYDITVQELARAQVTASTSTVADADSTIVAWGGSLNIGGVAVSIDAPVTLKGLAERINQTKDIGVTATVIKSGAATWQLVLTGRSTGTASQFSVTNALTGGTGIGFGDADSDGVSGDSAADNAVQATDARALVNNVQVVSSTNTLADAISGVTIDLLKKDPAAVTTVTVAEDVSTAKARIQSVITAFNDLIKFADDQNTAAANGDAASVGRDPLLRGLRNMLRSVFSADYPAGGTLTSLAAVGIEFQRTGKISFNQTVFDRAVASDFTNVRRLFAGDGTQEGAFAAITAAVQSYTKADGLLSDNDNRITSQVSSLTTRINDLTARLAVRRAALQQEYIAADLAMTQLKNDSSSLGTLGSQFRLF